ncbi:hypothetical protein IC575_005047 [Cucumis melo]
MRLSLHARWPPIYVCFDLLETLNQLEERLKDNIKKLSSFDKYKQEVLLGHLD